MDDRDFGLIRNKNLLKSNLKNPKKTDFNFWIKWSNNKLW